MTPCGFRLKGESMRKLTSPLKDEPDLISEASSMT